MRSIIIYPNPILKQEAADVNFPLNLETKSLIQEMWQIVKGKGVGLAAPQIGVSKKICIIHLSEDKEIAKKLKQKSDFVMINPKIIFSSRLESLMIEGCLSFPDQYYQIWRPSNVTVEYFNEEGKKQILKGSDWLSRVIQHEIDHLHGRIFTEMGGKKIEDEELLSQVVD